MAMNFMGANRADAPPIYDATMRQAEIANQLRQAEQQRRMMYGSAGASLAEKVPYSDWQGLGNALTGGGGAGATAAELAPSVVDPLTGAVASAAPQSAAATELLGAGALQSAAPTAALGAEAAGGAATAMGAVEGATAAGAGAGGIGPALASLGPLGWAALLGFGLMATDP